MDFIATLTDDCLLLIFGKVPLQHRLATVPLVCRRWAQLQPMVRRAVTSLTLIADSDSSWSYGHIRSPFYFVNYQRSIRDDPNLLKILKTFTEQLDPHSVARLLVELPHISQLTIIQLNHDGYFPSFDDELWSVMERYARQLTRFDFHYLYYDISSVRMGTEEDMEDGPVPTARTVLSADFQRLLALINYGMPRLRHLLLNSHRPVFHARRRCVSSVEYLPLGSLYLPVLRRLASFSFRTGDHEDVLLGSLRKFAGGAGGGGGDHGPPKKGGKARALKIRLGVSMYFPRESFDPPDPMAMDGQLWKDGDELLRPTLDYLFVELVELAAILPLLPSLASLQYLHLKLTDGGDSLVPLFTALSTNLPLLSRLHLDLGEVHDPVPEDFSLLPPLPSVTSLSLHWPFEVPAHFGAVLQPARVFPALQRLSIDGQKFEGCSYNMKCDCKFDLNQFASRGYRWGQPFPLCIRPALKASLLQYPPGAVPLINLNTNNGRKWFTVEEL